MKVVASIYDQLFAYESKKRDGPYPIHKRLKLPEAESIYHLIEKKVGLNKGINILDAGCGTGYGLLYLTKKYQASGLGVSLSEREIACAWRGLKNTPAVSFKCQNFDEPLDQRFDLIIGIESLKHSPDLEKTIVNLWSGLKPGGFLVISDDFIKSDWSRFEEHRQLWQVPEFSQLEKTVALLPTKNIVIETLTDFVPTRPWIKLKIILALVRVVLPFVSGKRKVNLRTYLGGLLLELGYALDKADYHLIMAKKESNG